MKDAEGHGDVYTAGEWRRGRGEQMERADPASGEIVWCGNAADIGQIDDALASAREAAPGWGLRSVDERAGFLEAYAEELRAHRDEFVGMISRETGKPLWEARTEVDAMVAKIGLTRQAFADRRAATASEKGGVVAATRYKPHGVVAVLGPFNLPGHLPNGHIAPALLAGNTVVFKPSELTPGVGAMMAGCWHEAGIPAGVVNLVQGGRDVGAALVGHSEIDGLFFTGSHAAGVAISRALADHPEKVLALEMGGNNPLVVADVPDVTAAALCIVESAFITAGQRCTCARRLILRDAIAAGVLAEVARLTQRLIIGPPTQTPEPFIGPVITAAAAQRLIDAQTDLQRRGGETIVPLERRGVALLRPGIIDVSAVADRRDEELFGPLLQVIRVPDFRAAIVEANRTRYGLVAGLISRDRACYEIFLASIRAGLVNWNRPTTGASSSLPFGGVGWSGNHRPSGYWAADYCSYPVASLEIATLSVPATLPPGLSI